MNIYSPSRTDIYTSRYFSFSKVKYKKMYFFLMFLFTILLFTLFLRGTYSLQETFSSQLLSDDIQKSYSKLSELNRKLESVDFNSPNKDVKTISLIDLKNQSTFDAVDDLIDALPQLIANHNYVTKSAV